MGAGTSGDIFNLPALVLLRFVPVHVVFNDPFKAELNLLKRFIKNLDESPSPGFIDDDSESGGGSQGLFLAVGFRDTGIVFLMGYFKFNTDVFFFPPAAMKSGELSEASPGDGCPPATQHVCLASARCSDRKKEEA